MKKPILKYISSFNFLYPSIQCSIDFKGVKVYVDKDFSKALYRAFIFRMNKDKILWSFEFMKECDSFSKAMEGKIEDTYIEKEIDIKVSEIEEIEFTKKEGKIYYPCIDEYPHISIDEKNTLIIFFNDIFLDYRLGALEVLNDYQKIHTN